MQSFLCGYLAQTPIWHVQTFQPTSTCVCKYVHVRFLHKYKQVCGLTSMRILQESQDRTMESPRNPGYAVALAVGKVLDRGQLLMPSCQHGSPQHEGAWPALG